MRTMGLPNTINVPHSRRQFLKTSAALGLSAAGMGLLGACAGNPATTASEETLETTTIRITKIAPICLAPQYLAEDILKSDGFTDVQYVETPLGEISGPVDFSMAFAGNLIQQIEKGGPIVILSGVHAGCFELFGTDGVNTIDDLKGKVIAIPQLGSSPHLFLASMLAYVGVDPGRDVTWAVHPPAEAMQFLAEGKVDALIAFPPDPQELRAKKIGHVVVNAMMDKPWSQYFCCMAAANSDFLKKNPVATKRALRAMLKAADLCALQPERAARLLVDKGFIQNFDYALEAMQEIPYNRWREYDPSDTLRFYALRLREAGMVKASPDEIIARGTDWRFLNEIKQEMKG